MATYKDTDKIISHLNDEIEACGDVDVYLEPVAYGARLGLLSAKSFIETAETADVQDVRHGKWITIGKDITERIVCSNCYSHKGSNLKPPFCNQCGAKMDGKEQEMNGEKQIIEEMAKAIAISRGYGCDNREHCDMSCYKFKCGCIPYECAEILYNEDYRKQSEVAKEIFKEIDKLTYRLLNDNRYLAGDICWDLDELKRKYTEESGNGR